MEARAQLALQRRPDLRGVALAAALVLAACATGRKPAPPPAGAPPPALPAAPAPADFFPLSVGNSWTFLDHSPQQPQATHHTVRIVGRDGEGYYLDDQNGALRADRDCLHDRERRLLCRPIQPGNTWSSVVSASSTERYRIAGVDETTTVPAGTFHGCVRVRSQVRSGGVEQVAELTYAPGVGLVRLETFAVVNGVATPQVRGELESYRLTPGK